MFVRNGQVLGSVKVDPSTSAEPEQSKSKSAKRAADRVKRPAAQVIAPEPPPADDDSATAPTEETPSPEPQPEPTPEPPAEPSKSTSSAPKASTAGKTSGAAFKSALDAKKG